MKIKYLDSYAEYQMLSEDGLYHCSDQKLYDIGCHKMNYILYKKDNTTKWCIDCNNDGKSYFYIEREGKNYGLTLKIVGPEDFLIFLNHKTPEALDWIVYNIDILTKST
jgi:hypothetical protein